MYIIHLNIQCCYLDIACFRRSSAKWLWFFSFTVWAVTALVLLEVPNLCLRSLLSRRTCTASAFCGATHLDMKRWPLARLINKQPNLMLRKSKFLINHRY